MIIMMDPTRRFAWREPEISIESAIFSTEPSGTHNCKPTNDTKDVHKRVVTSILYNK